MPLVLAALAASPYLVGGVSSSFINLDDPKFIALNPRVRDGLTLGGLRWALTSFETANWHPLTWVSHLLDVSLFGLQAYGHHLTSIALHALSTALLFLALRRMTGALWPGVFAAAVFGVHPVHVESVAWVAERKDVLSGLFFVLLLLAYERYVRRSTTPRYLGVCALFALGLAAKPMLVTAPFVLLLLDYWPLGRGRFLQRSTWLPLLVEKLPLFALSAAASLVTLLAQQRVDALIHGTDLPRALLLANVPVSYAVYLGQALWPASLAVYYPFPAAGYPAWQPAAAALALVAATAYFLVNFRRSPALIVGWLWFLGMLVPVIGFVKVGWQAHADRYLYLPLIGLSFVPAWGLPRLCAAFRRRPRAVGLAGSLAIAALAVAAGRQAGLWRDPAVLYEHTLAVTSGNWAIHNNLGLLKQEQGFPEEAAEHFRAATRLKPDYPQAHNNLGAALMKLGRPAEAVAEYREALRLQPDLVGCRLNLAQALAGLQRHQEAAIEYRDVLRSRPDSAEARFGLGNALAGLNRFAEAAAEYREALRLEPTLAPARLNLGNAQYALGRLPEASESYRLTLQLRPDSVEAHYNLGNVLLRLGSFDEAGVHFREASRLRPGQREILAGLEAAISGQQGRR